MDKQKIFWAFLTIILAVLALFLIVKFILKNEGFNEGRFRVNDVIITSTAELADKTEQNGAWSLNISQNNVLSILISMAENTNIKRVYLSDLKAVGEKEIVFYLKDSENRIHLNRKKQDLDIEYLIDNNTMLLEFVLLNENIIKNWKIPQDLKEIICDGRIFETAGVSKQDLEFNLSFKLNIVETSERINTVNIEVKVPNDELLTNGADVRRLDISEFKFKVK